MRKLISNLKIKQKIFLTILIPMSTIIVIAILTINERTKAINQLDYFHKYYIYYEKIGSIIHEIEKERQIAFSYIGSEGKKYKQQLIQKRKIIDNDFEQLNSFIKQHDNIFEEKLVTLLNDNIDQLELFRYDVDSLNLFLDIEKNFYTDLIYNLLYSASNIPAMTSNKYLSDQTLAYKYLIEAKEYLSLEAGLLHYIIASNSLKVKDISKLKFFDAFFKNNIMMFKYFVSKNVKDQFSNVNFAQYGSGARLQNILQKQFVNITNNLKKVRDVQNIKANILVSSLKEPLESKIDKINSLKFIEENLAKDILFTIKSEKDRLHTNLQLYILSIFLITIIVLSIGFAISRNIIKKVLALETGLVGFLRYIKREEKRFKPLCINGNDEINHMADIVNTSIKETAIFVEQEVKNAKLLQKQMMEAEKMVQMGEMIGNIAHQWRQPLSMISTVASGVKVNKEYGIQTSDEDLIKNMQEIDNYAQHLSQTIDTFRNFIKDEKELKVQSIQENIKNATSIVEGVLKNSNIELIDQIDYEDPIELEMVSGELPQVLINIINNAKDAITSKNITQGWVKLDMQRQLNNHLITIEDNAGGIPEEIIHKIFDPYFTTKHQTQGTGLGLHMSYRIVKESLNGNIYTQNTRNGAKFFIEIPYSI